MQLAIITSDNAASSAAIASPLPVRLVSVAPGDAAPSASAVRAVVQPAPTIEHDRAALERDRLQLARERREFEILRRAHGNAHGT
jgi:hypothetical protein